MDYIVALFLLLAYTFFYKNGLRGRLGIFAPISIIVCFSLVDFLVPIIFRNILNSGPDIPWMAALSREDQINGIVFYALFYFVMLSVLCLAHVNKPALLPMPHFVESKFVLAVFVVFVLWIIKLIVDFYAAGGVVNWFAEKAVRRWSGMVVEQDNGVFYAIINYIKWDFVINYLAFSGFYFRNELKKKWIVTLFLPVLATVCALLTFFRGAILSVVLGYTVVWVIENRLVLSRLNFKFFLKLAFVLVLVISLFVGIGVFRNSIESMYNNEDPSFGSSILVQGSGLDGVTHIVNSFSRDEKYLAGKTYFDMLLLPIPRAIYTSKPEWYGIDDISRTLGWPESTQSAVTLPGEAFANFGWFGLLVAPIYGLLFLFISKKLQKLDPPWLFWYLSVGIGMLNIMNWMAFTGLMNSVLTSLLVFLIYSLVFSGKAVRYPNA